MSAHANTGGAGEPLLRVDDLAVHFETDEGVVKAVDGVSFEVQRGEVLGIVGESGSGKSVANQAIVGLVPRPPGFYPRGRIHFDGQQVLGLSERKLRDIRGNRIAMIFQDPMTSLNPYLKVERQLTELLERHRNLDRRKARTGAIDMLVQVGMPEAERRVDAYPHELSGGMRQRVMIAMALLCEPELLIADEPTTALDVTIQAQVLDLIRDLQARLGTSVILITHDLGVVAGMAHRVAVMYGGRIVEQADTDTLFAAPRHPYTGGLLRSVPRIDSEPGRAIEAIKGLPPNPAALPAGCFFSPRCGRASERCGQVYPDRDGDAGHYVHCHHPLSEGEP
ncbi:MAG: ABC transporter ATP-binding protein [Myxococcales bacterium]|nr:ABC transporter ATP-binding protein [Myxococcales bacterium]